MPQCLIYKLQNAVNVKKEFFASDKNNSTVSQILICVMIPMLPPDAGNAVNVDLYDSIVCIAQKSRRTAA